VPEHLLAVLAVLVAAGEVASGDAVLVVVAAVVSAVDGELAAGEVHLEVVTPGVVVDAHLVALTVAVGLDAHEESGVAEGAGAVLTGGTVEVVSHEGDVSFDEAILHALGRGEGSHVDGVRPGSVRSAAAVDASTSLAVLAAGGVAGTGVVVANLVAADGLAELSGLAKAEALESEAIKQDRGFRSLDTNRVASTVSEGIDFPGGLVTGKRQTVVATLQGAGVSVTGP
jgi:hypothetical protein